MVVAGLGVLLGDVALADRGPISSRLPVSLASQALPESVVVASGDHLWKISDRHLHATLSHNPTSAEVVPYWQRVIDANQSTLRSGDPDLIFPGEVIRLPAVSERP